jgi:hypothetical protein
MSTVTPSASIEADDSRFGRKDPKRSRFKVGQAHRLSVPLRKTGSCDTIWDCSSGARYACLFVGGRRFLSGLRISSVERTQTNYGFDKSRTFLVLALDVGLRRACRLLQGSFEHAPDNILQGTPLTLFDHVTHHSHCYASRDARGHRSRFWTLTHYTDAVR